MSELTPEPDSTGGEKQKKTKLIEKLKSVASFFFIQTFDS
jgi:hypothetical protein